ncbi:MAG: penicillin acylase family protein [Fimbriimonadaceae bacterium]
MFNRRATTQSSTLASAEDFPFWSLLVRAGFANYEDNRTLAEQLSVPYKMGSYAILVSGKRSKSGNAMLLTAPQMGHRAPSIVHSCNLSAGRGINVAGMNVPGMPGVIIGNSPWAAGANERGC